MKVLSYGEPPAPPHVSAHFEPVRCLLVLCDLLVLFRVSKG